MANNGGIAVVLSIFLPGTGQVYNEQFLKAIVFFVIFVLSIFTLVLWPFVWLIIAWDAYSVAKGGKGFSIRRLKFW